jgi:hypothetical protein
MKSEGKLPIYRKYSFLKEISHEHVMVCLRLIKNMTQHMIRTLTTWKNKFKVQGLPQWSWTTPRLPLSVSRISPPSRNVVARMHGGVGKSERRGGDLNRRGLKEIRLNDVNSRLKLLFKHSRMFGVLLLNKEKGSHQTFQRYFKHLVYCFWTRKGVTSNVSKILQKFES